MSVKPLPGQLGLPGIGPTVSKFAALFSEDDEMASSATFEFKCRRCGEVFRGGTTALGNADVLVMAALRPELKESLKSLPISITLDSPLAPKATGMHKCRECLGGGTGVGDLIGYCVE